MLHGHAQRSLVFCFVIRVLTTTTAQCAVGNVTVEDEGCDDGRGFLPRYAGFLPWTLAPPFTTQLWYVARF